MMNYLSSTKLTNYSFSFTSWVYFAPKDQLCNVNLSSEALQILGKSRLS